MVPSITPKPIIQLEESMENTHVFESQLKEEFCLKTQMQAFGSFCSLTMCCALLLCAFETTQWITVEKTPMTKQQQISPTCINKSQTAFLPHSKCCRCLQRKKKYDSSIMLCINQATTTFWVCRKHICNDLPNSGASHIYFFFQKSCLPFHVAHLAGPEASQLGVESARKPRASRPWTGRKPLPEASGGTSGVAGP